MHRPVSATERVIRALGGTRRAAALLRLPPSTVQSWKCRGGIPRARHAYILRQAASHGIAIDSADLVDRNGRSAAP